MSLVLREFRGPEIAAIIADIARLRIEVFREWPYLYDGDAEYEREYLQRYTAPGGYVLGAFDGASMVGAATGTPLTAHAEEFAEALGGCDLPVAGTFYCAESVLRPAWRGQGVYPRFFAAREAEARSGGMTHSAFCAVVRPDDHPARPARDRPLDPVWRRLDYAPLDGAVAWFEWRDVGDRAATRKPLQFWAKRL